MTSLAFLLLALPLVALGYLAYMVTFRFDDFIAAQQRRVSAMLRRHGVLSSQRSA